MAKKKGRRRRKSSLINRAINAGLLALAFKPALEEAMAGNFDILLEGYTAGLSTGQFNKNTAARWYGPIAAAFILFEIKKMAMKKFRF